MKYLLKKMKEASTLMRGYHDKMQKETDSERRKELRVLFDGKSAEFKALEAEVADAKALAEADAAIEQAKSYHTPARTAGNLTPEEDSDSAPGKSKAKEFAYESRADMRAKTDFGRVELVPNYAKDQMLKGKIFADYIAFGPSALDGEAMRALKPASAKSEEGSVRMPEFMAEVVRAKAVRAGSSSNLIDPYSGKVILSTDATGYGTDSGAADLLAPDFRPQLLEYAVEEPSIYAKCSHFRSINGTVEWPMLDQANGGAQGGVAVTWKATEGADKGETDPVFTDFTLNTYEASAWTEMSVTALRRSSVELQSLITRLFRAALQAEWSRMVVYGSGTNRPQGVLNAVGKTTVQRAVATQVGWTDLTNLEYAVPMAQRRSGEYLIHDTVEKYLKQDVDSETRPLYTADVHSTIRNMLAGHPYTAHAYGAELGTPLILGVEGDTVFGDWKNYAFGMEEEITIARSEHVSFKAGRVVFRVMCYVGGKAIFPQHFAVLTDPA